MIKRWILIIVVILLLVAGYSAAAEQKIVIHIDGMTCGLWPLAVKKSLAGIKGVQGVKVSYEEKKAWLTADESVTDTALVKAVQKAGPYKGTVVERQPVN